MYYIRKAHFYILKQKTKPWNHSHILAVNSVYIFTKLFNYNIRFTAFFSTKRRLFEKNILIDGPLKLLKYHAYKFPNIAFPE